MKNRLIVMLGLCMGLSAFAQSDLLKGRLHDAANTMPLAGARIVTDLDQMTTSNSEGEFQLTCTPNMVLTITYVGYGPYVTIVTDCAQVLEIGLSPASETLDEVQVVGNHGQDPRTLEKPVSMVQLRLTELQRGTGLFLDDAIQSNVPGVTMNRRGVSSGQQFNIRGFGNGVGFRGANNNFDGQGYKVYYNNIPLTDAEGVTLMDDIDMGSIGQVNVIKGPAGSLYGLAIAGVVDLKTVRPEQGRSSFSQQVQLGSYGLLRSTTTLQLGMAKSSVLLNYGHQTSNGYMDHNASTKDFVNAVLEFRASEKQQVSAYFGFSDSYDQRGGELTIDQYEAHDYSGNSKYIKNDAHSAVKSFRAGVSHKYTLAPWLSNTTTVFGSGLSTTASSAGGWTDKTPMNYGTRLVLDLHFDLGHGMELSGIAGLEYQEQHAQIAGYRMAVDPNDSLGYNVIGDLRSNQFAGSRTHSLISEWVLRMPYGLSLTAGVGSSSMSLDLKDRLAIPGTDRESRVQARYTGLISPHVALNKVFNDHVSLYASYSVGYKAPVSGNIILSTTGGLNTGLRPEQGTQIEFGTKGDLWDHRVQYQVAVFEARFQDKFTSVAVPLDQHTTAYTYIANGGELDNKGLELLLTCAAVRSEQGFVDLVAPFVNATFSDFTYGEYRYQTLDADGMAVTADYSGLDVAGVAPVVVNCGVDLRTRPGIYANATASYRDRVPFTSDGVHVADPYTLLNAKLGYRGKFGDLLVDAFAGADNLTGSQYYYMLFLNQLEDAYIPAPLGVFLHGGLKLQYRF
ncbi:MAG: TonB-dependent receptor [Flavobacteriales bacterium]|nr:TonB-dependent receptor [Flavobacteriales bacterium]